MSTRHRMGMGAALAAAALIGCSHEQPRPHAPESALVGQGQGGAAPGSYEPYQANPSGSQASQAPVGTSQSCPMEVSGTRAAVVPMNGAVALDFSTATGDVSDLRTRVKAIASASNDIAMHAPAARGAEQGSGGREMEQTVTHIDARSSVQELPDGARIVFTPADAGQLGALEAQTQAMAAQLNQGDCSQLEAYGVQLSGPAQNPARKANRVPPRAEPSQPSQPSTPSRSEPERMPPPQPSANELPPSMP